MDRLLERDHELIAEARKAIRLNYDQEHRSHTVGAAKRYENGKVYVGVNLYSLHGTCAEQVAIGTAITNREKDFDVIVAVRGREGEEIIAPCGDRRQILHDHMPNRDVIVSVCGGLKKIKANELLPFPYPVG